MGNNTNRQGPHEGVRPIAKMTIAQMPHEALVEHVIALEDELQAAQAEVERMTKENRQLLFAMSRCDKLQASLDEANALLKTEQEESQRWREVSQKLGSSFYDARGLLEWAQKAWDDKDGKLVSHYPSGSGWKRKVDAFLAAQPQPKEVPK